MSGRSCWFFRSRPKMDPKKMWENEEKITLEERRKRYRCYKYYTLDEILTWPQFAQKYKLLSRRK